MLMTFNDTFVFRTKKAPFPYPLPEGKGRGEGGSLASGLKNHEILMGILPVNRNLLSKACLYSIVAKS
jgi:hypothetical protein